MLSSLIKKKYFSLHFFSEPLFKTRIKNLSCYLCKKLFDHPVVFRKIIARVFSLFYLKKIIDPARIRTWNPLIRSQMPYLLGHGAAHRTVILIILKITISSIVMVYKTHNLFLLF